MQYEGKLYGRIEGTRKYFPLKANTKTFNDMQELINSLRLELKIANKKLARNMKQNAK